MVFFEGPRKTIVILDGDDTLWRTMPLYTAAKRRFLALTAELGFESRCIEKEFEARDIRNVSSWGFTVERFRRSMVETYAEFSRKKGKEPTLRTEERISRIATAVVRNKTRPVPKAKAVLRRLHNHCRLVLLTKGEYALQERRVTESGFREFFELVLIVEHKNAETFRQVLAEFRAKARDAWSVGDSLRSDIKPALDAGLNAVWIPQATWGYEAAELPGNEIIRADTIAELPRILRNAGAIA